MAAAEAVEDVVAALARAAAAVQREAYGDATPGQQTDYAVVLTQLMDVAYSVKRFTKYARAATLWLSRTLLQRYVPEEAWARGCDESESESESGSGSGSEGGSGSESSESSSESSSGES